MLIPPIQITEQAILIPQQYLDAKEFVTELVDGYIVVRPKPTTKKKSWLQNVAGIAETIDPMASSRVKEILSEEIDNRSGWTDKPTLGEA